MKKQRVVLISGGSSGIGQSCARYFAAQGCKVYEVSRRERIQAGIVHITADVCDAGQLEAAVARIVADEGRLDLLIANAGFGIAGPIEETVEADFSRQFAVNVFGTVHQLQAVLPQMRVQGGGRIIVMSSLGGLLPLPFQGFYASSKAALISLARSLDLEVRRFGIRVTAFCPGDVKTDFTAARECTVQPQGPYAAACRASIERMAKDEQNGLEADAMARALWRLAQRRNPKTVVVGGAVYKLLQVLNKLLPLRLGDFILEKMYSPRV